MKRPDLIFISCFVLSLALLSATVWQNAFGIIAPRSTRPTANSQARVNTTADTERIKAKLISAGLVPVEAKYWKTAE